MIVVISYIIMYTKPEAWSTVFLGTDKLPYEQVSYSGGTVA